MKKTFLLTLLILTSLSLVSAGSHCRPLGDDDQWCCDDSGYVICGSTDTCGPNDVWCDNYLSGGKSCNGDKSRCCNDAGSIYAYNFDVCCPATSPYTPDGKWCYTTPQTNSDNWYTRKSECTSTSQTKCQALDFYQCSEDPKYIYMFRFKGATKGQCGVECVNGNDCPAEILGDKFCLDNTALMQNATSYTCDNYKCVQHIQDKLVEACTYKCSDTTCIPKICDENQTKCNTLTNTTEICINNKYVEVQKCNYGCAENGTCKTVINWNYYIYFVAPLVIISILVIILVLYLIRKSKN